MEVYTCTTLEHWSQLPDDLSLKNPSEYFLSDAVRFTVMFINVISKIGASF